VTENKRSRARGSSNPTISEVSALAAVSPMTVSRVMNGQARVTDSTRLRVENAIKQLGYRPNAAARQLAGGQLCRIGLLYNNPSSAYLSEILVGALECADDLDAELILEKCGETNIEGIGSSLIRQRIDAVILPPPLSDNVALLEQLAQIQIAAVMLSTRRNLETFHSITVDDEAAAHAITCHLIEKGHRGIGFIMGNTNQLASGQRALGYRRALEEHGLTASENHVAQGDFSFRSGFLAAEQILSDPNPPSAIFASNDDMAAGVVAAAHRFNLKVPAELSVCGFDDTSMALSTWPELSTIRQPVGRMARMAIELLVQSHRNVRTATAFSGQHLMIDFQLIERGSVAAPAQTA